MRWDWMAFKESCHPEYGDWQHIALDRTITTIYSIGFHSSLTCNTRSERLATYHGDEYISVALGDVLYRDLWPIMRMYSGTC